MKQNLLKTCVPLGTLLLLSGCIDDNYDLSDIDKTTQINVNDLVVPVNLEAIELSEIIKIDDDSKIKIVNLNGQDIYAVTQDGEFHSDDIVIDGFYADAPTIDPTTANFVLDVPSRAISETSTYVLDKFDPQNVSFKAENIDESIKELYAIKCEPLKIQMSFKAEGFDNKTTLRFKSLNFNFLKGLTLQNLPSTYKYDPVSGKLEISDVECPNHEGVVSVTAVAVNFRQTGTQLINQTFDFSSSIELDEAVMEMTVTVDNAAPAPISNVEFKVNTTVEKLTANTVTGKIEYKLEGESLNIDPVELTDIPDFLNDDQTNLLLANPQIYLNMNNPLAPYSLGFETGIELASVRGVEEKEYNLDPNQLVRVGYNHGEDGPYNFVLSPSNPSQPLDAYKTNLTHVGFASLSNVLSGNGLPDKIKIDLLNPGLPEQDVTDFALNNTIPGVKGTYDFLAPLALKTGDNGAVIVYRDSDKEWGSDDLDKLTITTLGVNATATSNLPISAKLSIYPLDRQGNRIPNVTVTPIDIAANAVNQPIELTVTGEIRDLDGISYEAVVHAGSENPLSPDQTIRLENVKAKVSGYYLTDFE